MFRKFTGIFILLSFFFIRTGVLPVGGFLDGFKKDVLEQNDKEPVSEENKEVKDSKKMVEDYFYGSDYLTSLSSEIPEQEYQTLIGKVTFVPLAMPCPPPKVVSV